MAKLTTKARKRLPTSKFALPAERKFPIEDRAHAANAKARAEQSFEHGTLSKAKRDKVFAAANKVLNRTSKKK